MKILITGAYGFVGTNLCRYLALIIVGAIVLGAIAFSIWKGEVFFTQNAEARQICRAFFVAVVAYFGVRSFGQG